MRTSSQAIDLEGGAMSESTETFLAETTACPVGELITKKRSEPFPKLKHYIPLENIYPMLHRL